MNEHLKEATATAVLSVVMPVYNGERYLKEAIDSVLNQTFRDFELLIINDGSSDRSMDIVVSYTDERIRILDNGQNRGIPYTRNRGLKEARGAYLAWCDCDDLLHPTRFEKQVDFMERHPGFGACGTLLKGFGEGRKGAFKASDDPEIVKATLLFKPSMPNATVMLRMSKVRELGLLYNPELPIAEDYEFVLRCSMHFPVTNLQEVLYWYRASETSIMTKFESLKQESDRIHQIVHSQALNYFGIKPSESELQIHRLITSEELIEEYASLKSCFEWLKRLETVNQENHVYEEKAFRKVLANQFIFASKKASKLGFRTWRFYLSKAPSSFGFAGLPEILKLTIRCIIRKDKF